MVARGSSITCRVFLLKVVGDKRMKEIPLTQDKVALVDDEDYERLVKFKRQYNNQRNYAHRAIHISEAPGTKIISMSCEILETDKLVDHKDHNGLNYQKYNLRICTYAQNTQNSRKTKKKTSSMYKGVSFEKVCKKWRADIRLRDIFDQRYKKTLGFFLEEETAAKAYDEAARFYFGEFAALNFPKEGEQSCLS